MDLKKSILSIFINKKNEIEYIKGIYKTRVQAEIDSYKDSEDEYMRDTIKVKDVLMMDSISI